jgi:hypothetical protein
MDGFNMFLQKLVWSWARNFRSLTQLIQRPSVFKRNSMLHAPAVGPRRTRHTGRLDSWVVLWMGFTAMKQEDLPGLPIKKYQKK